MATLAKSRPPRRRPPRSGRGRGWRAGPWLSRPRVSPPPLSEAAEASDAAETAETSERTDDCRLTSDGSSEPPKPPLLYGASRGEANPISLRPAAAGRRSEPGGLNGMPYKRIDDPLGDAVTPLLGLCSGVASPRRAAARSAISSWTRRLTSSFPALPVVLPGVSACESGDCSWLLPASLWPARSLPPPPRAPPPRAPPPRAPPPCAPPLCAPPPPRFHRACIPGSSHRMTSRTSCACGEGRGVSP